MILKKAWDLSAENPGHRYKLVVIFSRTGYNHLCVTVGDIRKTLQEIYEKGYIKSPEPEIEKSLNKNLWLYAPDGNKIELMMLDPDSSQSKA